MESSGGLEITVKTKLRAGGTEKMMIDKSVLRRIQYRAWHRGTKEADLLIGGFFDKHSSTWTQEQADLFETLLDEQDVDILSWAIGTAPCPPKYEGMLMQAMRALDYIPIAR